MSVVWVFYIAFLPAWINDVQFKKFKGSCSLVLQRDISNQIIPQEPPNSALQKSHLHNPTGAPKFCSTEVKYTCHSLSWCPTVPHLLYQDKSSYTCHYISRCPTVPMSHHITDMPNTSNPLLLCPTVSHCNDIYMLQYFTLSHCPTISLTALPNTCHSHLLCPTVPLPWQIHATLFYCVPPSHCQDKYMSLSFTVSHCPTVLLPWQKHVTVLYCVPLSHHLNDMRNTCHSLLMFHTVPLSHCHINTCHSLLLRPTVPLYYCHDKYMPLSFIVSHCPTISLTWQIHVTLF
jgi:hypothetical protein